ncbi:MAG TPA: aldehyde dehydrogenase family protein [Candidatus Sulfomarinibacteraceae bacterium]|nr:aldehyde dehydrogenase family protein [Candidatus Sulfomarinibacteraceae bacterium]
MSGKGQLPFINPATGEQFGAIRVSTSEEIARAMDEMRANLRLWREKAPEERARALRRMQALLLDRADEITRVLNLDTGKSRQDALAELFLVVDKLQTYRRHAPDWLAREIVPRGIYPFKRYYVERRPFGVVAVLGPWNYPLDLTMPAVFSALLAGNTVILKPSEVTPAVGALVEDLFRSVPALSPFVRVIHGDGEVGAELVSSGPDLVFLTGSPATGRKVAKATADTLTPFLCELGGKDPMIVLEDADIKEAAHWGVWGAFFHVGQTCISIERVYVVEAVYEPFLEAVLEETRRLKQGYSPHTRNPNDLGPLTFERQAEIIEDHLQDAQAKGARILLGGRREELFMEPTVVVGVDHSMKLMRDETFGPILPIMKVKDEEEAIRLANDSYLGLSASVWSNDVQRAERVAHRLEVGSVVVNDTLAHYAVSQLPFGGVKQSGTARTHGKQDVLQFTQTHAYGVGRTPFFLDIAARLRTPDRYRLLSALMHALFGTDLGQRLKAIGEGAHFVRERFGRDRLAGLRTADPEPARAGLQRRPTTAVAAAGLVAGMAALILSLLRGREKA